MDIKQRPRPQYNAYIHFSNDVHDKVIADNPESSKKNIMSIIAMMWNKTPEEGRAKYIAQAAADKERYNAEMNVFENPESI